MQVKTTRHYQDGHTGFLFSEGEKDGGRGGKWERRGREEEGGGMMEGSLSVNFTYNMDQLLHNNRHILKPLPPPPPT